MFLKSRQSIAATLIVFMSIGLAGCSDEEEVVEPIEPAQIDEPVQPPVDMGMDTPVAPVAPEAVYFAFDDYTLNMDSQDRLTALADSLKNSPSSIARIEGHCDERGSIEYNLALGDRRAQSVKNFLINLGVEESRLPTISYGEEKPSMEGHDEDSWSKNRRAEFVISAQ